MHAGWFAAVFGLAALASSPASAASYVWPLDVSIPVSFTNVPVSANFRPPQLQCRYYPTAGGGGYQFNGIFLSPTVSNGVASLSRTVTFSVNSSAAKLNGVAAAAPLSGDKIVCKVVTMGGTMQANGSLTSTLVLP